MQTFFNPISFLMKQLFSFALLCAAATASYADVNVTADPADGSRLEALSTITLTFADYDLVDLGSSLHITISDAKGASVACAPSYGNAENQMKLDFEKITAEGDYTVNVPAGSFVSGDGAEIPAFTLTYFIGQEAAATTVSPAPGDVQWLTSIIYCYDVPTSISADTYGGGKATLTSPSGKVQQLHAEYDWQIGNGKYTLRVLNLTTEVGEYTLAIPDDLFYYYDADYNKQYLPGGTFTYNVTGGELTQIEAQPAGNVYQFNSFEVAFPGYTSIAKNAKSSIYLCKEGKEGYVSQISLDYNVQAEDGKLIYTNSYSTVIEPGHYYMAFPDACVLLGGEDGVPSTPFQFEFDIVEPEAANIVITPAEGETVNMLNHVVISFPDEESVTVNSSASLSLYKVLEDGTRASIGGAYGDFRFAKVDDHTFDAALSGLATEDGDYVIVLTKNSFTLGNGFNQEVEVNVHFEALPAPAVAINPEEGTVMDKIQHFVITFPDEAVVKLNTTLSAKNTILYVGAELIDNGWGGYSNQQAGSTSEYMPVEGSTNSFAFSLSSAAITKGEYLLVMPAGIFLMGEDEHNFSPAFRAVFSASGEGVDKVEVYPNHPVAQLDEMSITFVNESSISLQNDYVGFSFYKVNAENAWDDYVTYISNEARWVEGNTLHFQFVEPYAEPGEYYIELTQWNLFMSDGITACTPQRISWIVDPEWVETNISRTELNAAQRTYNLQGMEVHSAKGLVIKGGQLQLLK